MQLRNLRVSMKKVWPSLVKKLDKIKFCIPISYFKVSNLKGKSIDLKMWNFENIIGNYWYNWEL